DELNRTEPLPASYNLVEQPAEEQKAQVGAAEQAAPRPEAAVRGITPQQPAPIPTHAAAPAPAAAPTAAEPVSSGAMENPSIIGKLFGWLKRKPADAVPSAPEPVMPQQSAPPPAQRERGPRRGGRHKRHDRDGQNRDERQQQGGHRQRQEGGQQ